MADGLSALAVNRHAAPLLDALMPLLDAEDWRLAPLTVVLQARVALGDEIGERLGARQVVMLIGERPGLTAPDSLGIYLTYDPRPGRTEAERNCISNVRPEGLPYELAARKLHFLMREARVRKLTGVALKGRRAVTRLTRLRATPSPNSTPRQTPPSPPAHRMFRLRCAIPPRQSASRPTTCCHTAECSQ